MKHGFVKIALCVPTLKVGAPDHNAKEIIKLINQTADKGAELIAFGELSLSGSTCGSMFRYKNLLDGCQKALSEIAAATSNIKSTIIVGLPLKHGSFVLNAAAVIFGGEVKAFVVGNTENKFLDNCSDLQQIEFGTKTVPIGDLIISAPNIGYNLGVVVGEDCDRLDSKSTDFSRHGANIIVNISAAAALVYSYEKRQHKIAALSEKLNVGYAYVSTGKGESVANRVYCGDKILAENGDIITAERGDADYIISELDVDGIESMRRIRRSSFKELWRTVTLDAPNIDSQLNRYFSPIPFVPSDPNEFEHTFDILARGIYTRMNEIGTDKVILGLSGGLDSTIVLVSCAIMFDKYKLNRKNIIAVTMSGGGSSARTQNNAAKLISALNVTRINIPIAEAVTAHLSDIGHSDKTDVVYENAQARERAQILLDLSNKHRALMLGTGDLSEIALGWSTYGGDQLAQYNPNSSISKTMIRAMMRYYVLNTANEKVAAIINDVLLTPISPELIANQETEKVLGPYEIHDFILYHLVGKGYGVAKTMYLLRKVFPDRSEKLLKNYFRTFITRFFINQFKRNFGCDGIKLSEFDLSEIVLNSDFSNEQWLKELDKLV